LDNRLHYGGINGTLQQAIGDAYAPDPSVPGYKLAVTFHTPIEAPCWVLATDHTSYTMVFSCTDFFALGKRKLATSLGCAVFGT